MKILQITNKAPFPENDGGAIACMNMLRGLHAAGHKLTLLSMVTLKHPVGIEDIPEEIKSLADIRLIDVPAPINKWAALVNLLFSKLPYNASRFLSNPFSMALRDMLTEEKYDLVQLEGLYVCPYIPVVRKYSQAKIAYRAHNIEHEIWARAAGFAKGPKKWYLRNLWLRIKKFEMSFVDAYDLLVPITQRDALILDGMGNTRPVHVSQTGFDLTKFSPIAYQVEQGSIFHIGALDWVPNQEGLLWFLENCWPQISSKFPSAKFYVAGRNAPAWLVKKITDHQVVYEGEVNDAHVFMGSKALMVVPLHSGSGMRVKIIEGMALGKPIVSTKIGAEGISVASGENIMLADTPEDFSEKVVLLLENQKLMDEVGARAHLFIQENFDNLVLTEKLADFYKKHLG